MMCVECYGCEQELQSHTSDSQFLSWAAQMEEKEQNMHIHTYIHTYTQPQKTDPESDSELGCSRWKRRSKTYIYIHAYNHTNPESDCMRRSLRGSSRWKNSNAECSQLASM
jgi:hypothetical protein